MNPDTGAIMVAFCVACEFTITENIQILPLSANTKGASFYDHEHDPYARQNLAGKPKYADALVELKRALG
jgi:hypothetical protein